MSSGLRILTAALATTLALSCRNGGIIPGFSSPSAVPSSVGGGSCKVDFGVSSAASRVESFVLAVDAFVRTSTELKNPLLEASKAVASELGVGTSGDLRAVCDTAKLALRKEMTSLGKKIVL